MKLLALLACVASLVVVAGACGGDDNGETESADAWADEFCTTVNAWTDELERIRDDLGDVSSLTSESLEDAADEAEAETDEFLDEIRDLGAPETESGEAVETEIDEFADSVEAEKEEIRQAVDDASGLGGLADAIGTIGTSIAAMATELEQTLDAIDTADADGEVRQALEDSEACDQVTD
jgi:hypothetical protein